MKSSWLDVAGRRGLRFAAGVLCLAIVGGRWIEAAEAAPKLVLKKGARVAIVGDSITEQKLYSRYMEDYLLMCVPELELRVCQFGWGGERASGFALRMDNDLMPFKPDVVTTCYGMNDGSYVAYNDTIGKAYRDPMKDIVSRLKKAGAIVVVGSPGAVDSYYFNRVRQGQPGATTPKDYNDNLAKLRDIAQEVAKEFDMPFANVHDPLMQVMEKAKAKDKFGEAFDVCGMDGVHPNANGHLVMAYAFLKAMGLDGTIGTITVDLKGQTTVSDGHKLVSSEQGKIEVESTRYPFCCFGDPRSPASPRSILPLLPFNEDLNRFTLIVKNADRDKVSVTWGAGTKEFTRQELEQGINLAAEFPDNPFAEQFRRVDELVARKQLYETTMIKGVVTNLRPARTVLAGDAEVQTAVDVIVKKLFAKDEAMHQEVRAAITPVRHTIVIAAPPAAAAPATAPAAQPANPAK